MYRLRILKNNFSVFIADVFNPTEMIYSVKHNVTCKFGFLNSKGWINYSIYTNTTAINKQLDI